MVLHVRTESMNIVVGAQLNTEESFVKSSQWCWDNKCTLRHHHVNITTVSMEYALRHLEATVTCVNAHQDTQVIAIKGFLIGVNLIVFNLNNLSAIFL